MLLGDDGNRVDFNGLEYHLTAAFFIRKERGDINAATLRSKVGELEELSGATEEEADDEAYKEPKYTDSLVPWPVGS